MIEELLNEIRWASEALLKNGMLQSKRGNNAASNRPPNPYSAADTAEKVSTPAELSTNTSLLRAPRSRKLNVKISTIPPPVPSNPFRNPAANEAHANRIPRRTDLSCIPYTLLRSSLLTPRILRLDNTRVALYLHFRARSRTCAREKNNIRLFLLSIAFCTFFWYDYHCTPKYCIYVPSGRSR